MKTQFFATVLIAAIGYAASPSYAGNLAGGEVGYVPAVPTASASGLSREAVRNDYLKAQRDHTLVATGEGADIGYAGVTNSSTRSRQDVRNEYLQAARDHELAPRGEGADIGYVASRSVLNREAALAEAARGRGANGGV